MASRDDDKPGEILNAADYARGGAKKGPAAADGMAALPDAEDEDYKAAGTPESHEIPCLVVILNRRTAAGGPTHYAFEYPHIGNLELVFPPRGGILFTFLYSGLQPKFVIVRGDDMLLKTWHLVGQRRLPWIRQADQDFRAAGGRTGKEPVITGIEVYDWTRPKPDAAELMKALADVAAEELEELEDA